MMRARRLQSALATRATVPDGGPGLLSANIDDIMIYLQQSPYFVCLRRLHDTEWDNCLLFVQRHVVMLLLPAAPWMTATVFATV